VRRFLFVVPPLVGHVNPTVSIARELERRGHEVAWAAHPARVRPLLPEGATLLALDDRVSDSVWAPLFERARSVRGLESYEFLWDEVLVPLARAMRPEVEAQIASWSPDVVVVDHQAIGGALAARRAGARWASLCTTSASVVYAFADLPKIKQWSVEEEAALAPVDPPDLSPELVIVLSTAALVGPTNEFPPHYRFVGPCVHDRPDATPFPWELLRDGPRVLVSLGTVSADRGDDFYATVVQALANAPMQVVLVAPQGRVPDPPANFLVLPRVPQLALLPHVHAVVSHAGHNTVCEALAHGVPLVVAPIRDDQPIVASQVVAAGAGLRVRFGRLAPGTLRGAVDRVLGEPSFRQAAARVGASFAEVGGAVTAAGLLEGLLSA
jgi:UDP:flavonoid glycosyltransferase YjiC (YdhE family)